MRFKYLICLPSILLFSCVSWFWLPTKKIFFDFVQCPQFQVQGTAGVVHPYTPIATSHMPYEMQGSNVTR